MILLVLLGDNQKIEFHIAGYEFDEICECWYDNNWLMLKCRVTIGNNIIEGTFPCFLTTELKNLQNQLQKYNDKSINSIDWGGTEPNFSIEIHENRLLEIFFYPENRTIEFNQVKKFKKYITNEDVQTLIQFCEDSLQQYPVRNIEEH